MSNMFQVSVDVQ